MPRPSPRPAASGSRPRFTKAEAERALDDLAALIEKLTAVIEQETALVRAGQLRRACTLEGAKAQLASQLHLSRERLRANAEFLLKTLPARCAALATLQDGFRAVLQRNMIVLATAHSVSEGIVRRLSSELTRQASPQIYGATGRAAAPNPRHGRPLAVSRTL
jgi:flagellar biosynthesis/type III secretory pathway chaperone